MGHLTNQRRQLVVVAGCNGASKTTYVGLRTDLRHYTRLDPDALYARFGSWRRVSSAIDAAFASCDDLVLETTFSGKGAVERIRKAKEDGFHVTLIFIGTASPEVNVERIAKRVREGGHDVPRDDIERRWPRCLENLRAHLKLADLLLLFDNSTIRFPIRAGREVRKRRIFSGSAPARVGLARPTAH